MTMPNPKINRDRGKRSEKAVATRLKGRRLGTLGAQDVETSLFSVEVKSRQRFVGEAFLSQARSHCPLGKIPLAVVHLHGQRHNDDIVLLRLRDFQDLHGTINN
jgi:hypothetical protein